MFYNKITHDQATSLAVRLSIREGKAGHAYLEFSATAKDNLMPKLTELFIRSSLGKAIQKSIEAQLTTGLHETDNTFYPGNNMSVLYRDRYDYDRQTILGECLRAWRVNPVARRIVKLYTQFIIGSGIKIESNLDQTTAYLKQWWRHPLNRLDQQAVDWCDELTRSGNMFFLCTVDQATSMIYIRAVPADQVDQIVTRENDILQEVGFVPTEQGKEPWPAYDGTGKQVTFMLHFAMNRRVGVAWGEPDLAPMLPWIGRYSSWLEDRARLNRFRGAFIVTWKRKWNNEAEKRAKSNELAANPPQPGSWLLLDQDEEVETPSPNLNSADTSLPGRFSHTSPSGRCRIKAWQDVSYRSLATCSADVA